MSQGGGLSFPCSDRIDEVNKLFTIWPLKHQKKSKHFAMCAYVHKRSFKVMFPLYGMDHFTVVCLAASPLNESEAGVDLV